MSNKAIAVYAEAYKRQQRESQPDTPKQSTPKAKKTITRSKANTLDTSSDKSRKGPRVSTSEQSRVQSRVNQRDFPTRDEIQEFSFHLRDEVKVKVQAEIPHPWQKELQEIARILDVKKLELYRYMIGEFLGKVKRKDNS